METQISKYAKKRERRKAYYQTLDGEVLLPAYITPDGKFTPPPFKARVMRTLNNGGWDFSTDGSLIRADFWRYIRSRRHTSPNLALAAQQHLEQVVAALRGVFRRIENASYRQPVGR